MSRSEQYQEVVSTLDDFLSSYDPKLDQVALMATINSVLKSKFQELVFVGFYICRSVNNSVILEIGPYQGDVLACARIEFGKGVCGTSAQRKETVIVENVLEIENYIACDCLTRSEIVVPVIADGELKAVFDIDSKEIGFFTEIDKEWLERIVKYLT